jgi:hypothetical protein
MQYIQLLRHTEPRSTPRGVPDFTKYIVSFGSEFAPNKVDIFYGVECGFSKEFLQQDFEKLLVTLVLTGKAYFCLYPAALDRRTLEFCSMLYTLPPAEKRKLFMQLCHPTDYPRLISKIAGSAMENALFDVSKILERNPEISETLMIRVNRKVLEEIPSVYSLQRKIA